MQHANVIKRIGSTAISLVVDVTHGPAIFYDPEQTIGDIFNG